MKLSLVVLTAGKSAGQVIPVPSPHFVIGRDPQCQLRPASVLISKRHCALRVDGGRVMVEDFNSTNGTFINDEAIQGEVEVKNGDTLKVGPLEFRLAIEGVAGASPRTPRPVSGDVDGFSQDDIGDMLLDMSDDMPTQEADAREGSTILEMPVSSLTETAKMPKPGSPATTEKKKIEVGSAQSAAQALLAKLNKRVR